MNNLYLKYLSEIKEAIEKNFEKLVDSNSRFGGIHVSVLYQIPSTYQRAHHELQVKLDNKSSAFNIIIPQGCPSCSTRQYEVKESSGVFANKLICSGCQGEYHDICFVTVKEILENELFNFGINVYDSLQEFLSRVKKHENENA